MKVYNNNFEFQDENAKPSRVSKFSIGDLVWVSLFETYAVVVDISAYWEKHDEYDYLLYLQNEMEEVTFVESSIQHA